MPPQDPYRNFNFLVEIDGISQVRFAECSGIGGSIDIVTYREGGDPTAIRKLPGLTHYTNIVLKWGVTDSHELEDWFHDATAGKIQLRKGSITLLDQDGTPRVRWNFVGAWPARWEGPHLIGDGTQVAIETLELAHEGITRAT